MNETEEALSSCIEEVLKKSDAVQCCTTEQRNVLINENDEIIESCSNVVVNKSNDVKSTNPEGSVEIKGSSCCVRTSSEHHIATEDVVIDPSALAHPKTEISDVSQLNQVLIHERIVFDVQTVLYLIEKDRAHVLIELICSHSREVWKIASSDFLLRNLEL